MYLIYGNFVRQRYWNYRSMSINSYDLRNSKDLCDSQKVKFLYHIMINTNQYLFIVMLFWYSCFKKFYRRFSFQNELDDYINDLAKIGI